MGSYSVIGADGQTYGPIDEAGLKGWVQAGRVLADTQIIDGQTGQTTLASSLGFLAGLLPSAPPAAPPWMPAPPMAPMMPMMPMAPMGPGVGYDGYGLAQPGTPEAAAHRFSEFPVAVAILLHYVSFGIFTMIWLNLMHGKMPKIRHDDPSAGKAIGFMFIPVFNLYWIFFTYTRLCLRINEQRQMRNLPPKAPPGLAIGMCILRIIPYIGLISLAILEPIFSGIIQSSVNDLAKTSRWA